MIAHAKNAGISTKEGQLLRAAAVLLALSLMVGECWRSWGIDRPIMLVLDDQIMGGFLIAAAWAFSKQTPLARAAFSAAWGVIAGMLYSSFFGKLFEPSKAQAGNWNLEVLTWLIGFAFAVSVVGLWRSIAYNKTAALCKRLSLHGSD